MARRKQSGAHTVFLSTLHDRVSDLADFNINSILNDTFGSSLFRTRQASCIAKILASDFFLPSNREDDGSLDYKYSTDPFLLSSCGHSSPQTVKPSFGSLYTHSLIPIADSSSFQLRLSPHDSITHRGAFDAPNRNFFLCGYSWSSLLPLKTLISSAHLLDLPKLLACLCPGILQTDTLLVTFWSTTHSGAKYASLTWQHSSYSQLLSFLNSLSQSKSDLSSLSDYISFKVIDPLTNPSLDSDPPHINLTTTHTSPSASPKAVVVFIDSLDLSCLDLLPDNQATALRSAVASGLNFDRFTSSGDWTYPCLHSLYSGCHPRNTLSLFRSDPYLTYLPPQYLSSLRELDASELSVLFSSQSRSTDLLPFFFSPSSPIPGDRSMFLSRLLREHNLSSVGLKHSVNNGWRFSFSSGFDFTLEAPIRMTLFEI